MRLLFGMLLFCALLCGCGTSGNATFFLPSPTPATGTPTNSNGGATPTPPHNTAGGPTKTATKSPGVGTPTRTPTPIPAGQRKTYYVRVSGSDSNSGTSPAAAFNSVAKAATRLVPGAIVYVGPGHYTEPTPGRLSITAAGTASAPVQLIADTTGVHTGDAPGEVILDAGGDTVALLLTKASFLIVDGFTITGALPESTPVKTSASEIGVRSGSNNVTIRNCVIGQSSSSDGIRIDKSTDVLVFDNLVFENDRGIVITGASTGARLINNTIANSGRTGVALTLESMMAPTGATLTNNIITAQTNHLAINVDQGPPSAQDGYDGDFNLVFEPDQSNQTKDYSPADILGANDINSDPLLVDLEAGDAHLEANSPAIDKGSDDIDPALESALLARSTQADGSLDVAPVDMGYHYP